MRNPAALWRQTACGRLLVESVKPLFTVSLCSNRQLWRRNEFTSKRSYTMDSSGSDMPPLFGNKEVSRAFMSVFPDVVREVSAERKGTLPEVEKWLTKIMQYNVPTGKKYRGLSVVHTYLSLTQDAVTEDALQKAYYLGWMVEMLHAFFLIQDDIMDGSYTRRGKAAWYRVEGVGMGAVNDAVLLEKSIYFLLKKKYSKEPWYMESVDLFNMVTLKTAIGQCLDVHSKKADGSIDVPKFTVDRHEGIAKFKTAFYSLYLPVSLGMHLAGRTNPELHRQAKVILLEIGEFLQMQDDYLDCYGRPEVTGKTGTDIVEGKVTWVSVMALQRANAKQKEMFREHYGQSDPASVQKIREFYDQIDIPHIYRIVEKESYERITRTIQQASHGIPKSFLLKLMDALYKRDQ
ncbi:unnamed protein product [Cyprideis torosa]|uniref:Farnesyl pyrophosphate synthase n=1 Tax=Cyprideis torosa TaxID=163714 RepID=A0A7R8W528_9CRUS|nr:unnamed protein product [Cyprideis torosa]CAG0880469.1 unnamed protein product [Cyprideis torosa]